MTTPSNEQSLEGLVARVKAATGPDRELDLAFWLMFDPEAPTKHAAGKVPLPWLWDVTASVDAALALVERCLPGWFVDHMGADASGSTGDMKTFGWTVEVSDNMTGHQGSAPTLSLAILAALLTALKDAST